MDKRSILILGKRPGWFHNLPLRIETSHRRGQVGIGAVLGVFITALIAVVLAGPFLSQVTANLVNYTGGAKAIGDQLPLFYILLLVAIIIIPVAREFNKLD